MDLIIDEKFVNLKSLLKDGSYDAFEKGLDYLSNEDLIYFAYFGSTTIKKEEKSSYYYNKLVGEVIHNLISRKAFNGAINSERNRKVLETAFQQLASAFESAFNGGYWNDVEKFGRCLIGYPYINDEDYVYFLGLMATSSYNRNDVATQVEYCRLMYNRIPDSPSIWSQLAYALMINEEYDEAKRLLHNCIDKGYNEFHVYNQLSNISLYQNQNFDKSLEYLTYISKSIKPLNDRQNYLLYMNILSSCGLSGDIQKNNYIDEFIQHTELKDGLHKEKWITTANYFKSINIGLYHLGNGDFYLADKELQRVGNAKDFEGIYKFGAAIRSIIGVLTEIHRIKDKNDASLILLHLSNIEIDQMYQKYLNLISIYVQVIAEFYKIESEEHYKPIQFESDVNKIEIRNLLESDLLSKIFKLINLLRTYTKEYDKTILKRKYKDELFEKFRQVRADNIELGKDLKLLYFTDNAPRHLHVVDLTVKSIILLQRSEPSFIRNYRLSKFDSLYESDFRDVIYQTFGLTYDVTVTSESLSKKGHTDLQIFSKKLGDITFEFKIWGKNDYKGVVTQLLGYLTSNQYEGYVFMINPNKSSINSIYTDEVIVKNDSYVPNSILLEMCSGYNYIVSQHKTSDGIKSIYHFIYNIY